MSSPQRHEGHKAIRPSPVLGDLGALVVNPPAELPGDWGVTLSLVARFEARLRQLHLVGLTLWTGSLRNVILRLFRAEGARRAQAYEQLMLIEHELDACPITAKARAGLLMHLGMAKGALATVMIAMLCYAAVADQATFRAMRRRGRRRDEIELVEGEA